MGAFLSGLRSEDEIFKRFGVENVARAFYKIMFAVCDVTQSGGQKAWILYWDTRDGKLYSVDARHGQFATDFDFDYWLPKETPLREIYAELDKGWRPGALKENGPALRAVLDAAFPEGPDQGMNQDCCPDCGMPALAMVHDQLSFEHPHFPHKKERK